jgi:hypothetical protein
MHEPSPRTSRLLVAGAALAIVLLGGGGFLLGRSSVPEAPPAVVVPSPPPVVRPTLPAKPVVRVLARSDMISIANAAADAASSGQTPPESVKSAAAEQFEIYLPFGCDGPAPADSNAPFRWRYDADTSSLRISVAPVSWEPGEWLRQPSGDSGASEPPTKSEAIEGFWISRPWSSLETCESGAARTAPQGIDAVTLPGQTLGLAQIFSDEDSRIGRRAGKPYEAVIRMDEKDLNIESGLRVRLRGRISRFPGDLPVRCRQPAGKDQRPVCLVAVTFDDVAVDNPVTQQVMATWASASRALTR